MSLTRSLTLPLTRALSHAELTQKLGGSFSPYALNPYLLFDARDSMIGTLENPTLDLNPALPETLDVITAVRAGVATYTDESGLIQEASANTVRVDQTQGAELTPTKFQNFGYTDFSSGWTAEGGTLTESQTPAPDGTTPVYELTENTSTSRHRLFYSGIPLVVGQTYTVSAYVKKVSSGRFFLINTTALNGIRGFLNLDTGVATLTSGTGTIAVTDEGDDWYRLSVTAQATTTNGFVYMQLQNAQTDVTYTGTGASFLIYGPQLEEGTTASSFVANTTGSPKFITGATYGPRVPMILVEPSATNLINNSNSNNLNFALDGVSMTYSVTGSPDGETNGILLQQTGSHQNNSAYNYGLPTADGDYSHSIFVKAADSTSVRFYSSNGATATQTFNPQNMTSGTVAGGLNLNFEDFGNGWFRVSFTRNLSSAPHHRLQIYPDRSNTQKGVYIFGLQVENNSTVATSYIPTSGSAVTRAADDLTITGSAFSDFFNASEGTIYCEALTYKSGYNALINISDGTFNERTVDWSMGSGINGTTERTFRVDVFDGGVAQANLGSNTFLVAGQLEKGAFTYKVNDFAFCHAGGTIITDSSGTLASPTEFNLGSRLNSSHLNGHIKRVIYWPNHSDSL